MAEVKEPTQSKRSKTDKIISDAKKKAPRGYMSVREVVGQLAGIGMSINEIAAFTKRDKQAIGKDFREAFEEGRAHIVKRLREAQLEEALGGRNVQMLIHLGKFFLDQREMKTIEVKQVDDTLKNVSTDDLIALVKEEGKDAT